MTNKERLAEIKRLLQDEHANLSVEARHEIVYLISRVKALEARNSRLTEALEDIGGDLDLKSSVYAMRAHARKALSENTLEDE